MLAVGTKTSLVIGISECSRDKHRNQVRRFLRGLSTDELQFIAQFLGGHILESQYQNGEECALGAGRERIGYLERFMQGCAPASTVQRLSDRDHKVILLQEYLSRSGFIVVSVSIRSQ